jgi:hypothetical protein
MLPDPAAPSETLERELQFFEPRLPDASSHDWQGLLRQIFETEGGIWQRRGVTRGPASPRR